jgi:Zn finger protein HypA/HybF involved in hydrogenase expression
VVHELEITQGIIERAREAAQKQRAGRVRRLHLVMTPEANFSAKSIETHFAMLTEGESLFAEASLEFAPAPAGALCLACGDEFVTEAPQPLCPQCGSPRVRFDPKVPAIQLTSIDADEGDRLADKDEPGARDEASGADDRGARDEAGAQDETGEEEKAGEPDAPGHQDRPGDGRADLRRA